MSALVCCTAFAGCGGGGDDGPTLYRVSGTVSHQGQPLKNIVLKFSPPDGTSFSSGMSDEQGKFTLQYTMNEAGAVAGENVVYVEYVPSTPEEESAAAKPGYVPPSPYKEVIEKYGSLKTSPYRVTIDKADDALEVRLD